MMMRTLQKLWSFGSSPGCEDQSVSPAKPESRVAQTILGPIEYSELGRGPAVLVIHGCPGGFDQGLIAAKLAKNEQFRFIALSRPGYLRTPLSVGASPEAQADAYAALLDTLGIPAAAVIGISGGGPSALQFALRHPERCLALVTLCAISRRLSQAEIMKCKSVTRRVSFAGALLWALIRHGVIELALRFRSVISRSTEKELPSRAGEPNRRDDLELIMGLLGSFRMMSRRKSGLFNDTHQLIHLSVYPLEKITAPTLVLHGRADELVDFSHAETIVSGVSRARMIEIEDGDHLFFATHQKQVVPAIFEFLRQNTLQAIPDSLLRSEVRGRQVATPSFTPALTELTPSETA